MPFSLKSALNLKVHVTQSQLWTSYTNYKQLCKYKTIIERKFRSTKVLLSKFK